MRPGVSIVAARMSILSLFFEIFGVMFSCGLINFIELCICEVVFALIDTHILLNFASECSNRTSAYIADGFKGRRH